jgi:hypothetical protein
MTKPLDSETLKYIEAQMIRHYAGEFPLLLAHAGAIPVGEVTFGIDLASGDDMFALTTFDAADYLRNDAEVGLYLKERAAAKPPPTGILTVHEGRVGGIPLCTD